VESARGALISRERAILLLFFGVADLSIGFFLKKVQLIAEARSADASASSRCRGEASGRNRAERGLPCGAKRRILDDQGCPRSCGTAGLPTTSARLTIVSAEMHRSAPEGQW